MFFLSGYTTIRALGRGGFGQTWLLQSDGDGTHIAVKVLHQGTEDALQRFAREARMLQRNQGNPYVVDILGCSFLPGQPPYIVLEYCDGGSLESWITQRRPWREVTLALANASAGLDHLHGLDDGFHRDIKPQNLLLKHLDPERKTWVVKVCDFGLARAADTVGPGMTRSPGGTRGYMAPELPQVGYHRPADIYSLGVTGIELLTGSKDPTALVGADGPPALHDLLRRMCSPDWRERPTMSEVNLALQLLLVPQKPKAKKPVKKNTGSGWGWLAAGAALLALGTMNSKDSDGRWRGSDGRYRSGPWG